MRSIYFCLVLVAMESGAIAQIRVGNMDPDIKIKTQGGPQSINLQFVDRVKVPELLAIVAKITGKNVIVRAPVNKEVTLFARGEHSKTEAYELIVSALSTVDLMLEHHGRYLRLVTRPKT